MKHYIDSFESVFLQLCFQITLSLIGKFGATASFAIVFVYTAEMFPTEIRSTAVGASSLCGRVGGIIAPQVRASNEPSRRFHNHGEGPLVDVKLGHQHKDHK